MYTTPVSLRLTTPPTLGGGFLSKQPRKYFLNFRGKHHANLEFAEVEAFLVEFRNEYTVEAHFFGFHYALINAVNGAYLARKAHLRCKAGFTRYGNIF